MREGKVAQFLNGRELVITLGRRDGVREHMRFAILADMPLEIHDPDSQELLGTVDREKVRVEATRVEDRFAICATYQTVVTGGGFATMNVADLFAPRREKVETLTASGDAYPPALPARDSYVKIGDRVRQVTEPAFALPR